MTKIATPLPVKVSKNVEPARPSRSWPPFQALRSEIERVFDDFDGNFWGSKFPGNLFNLQPLIRQTDMLSSPAVDVAEKERAYEISAELPGMTSSDIEVSVGNGVLTIKGEKQEEKEESKKDYYLKERRFGSFERRFDLPDDIEAAKIEAAFSNGVLRLTLPKTAEAQKPEQKITVKAA